MGKWGTGKIKRKCEFCENEFYARRDRLGKFCSKSCSSRFKPKRFLRIKKECAVCSKEYEIKLYRKDISLYCSRECRQKRMPKKEKHPAWKGGFSRTWESRSLIRKLIKEKGHCEICKEKNNLPIIREKPRHL